MAILKVARMGHPVLRHTAKPVPDSAIGSKNLKDLVDDLVVTMREYAGIGLAAPQVHIPSRVVIVAQPWTEASDEETVPTALINPEIVDHSNGVEVAWEGCLSIPGIRGEVGRWDQIRVRAVSPEGETLEFDADGFPARVIQHEADHLDGILFLDRMENLERLSFLEEYSRYWQDEEE